MNAHQKILLPDVQASQDRRNIVIQKVGVRSVTYPVKVEGAGGVQHSIATVDMYVRLPADVKGTHMSRFLEVLEEREAPLSAGGMRDLFEAMCARLESTDGEISMRMPYFVRKRAPVSGVESLLDYQLHLQAVRTDGVYSFTLGVQVPVTSLCPCSKKISDYGAHNQRSHIIINATLHDGSQMQPEELIAIAEESASCELWGLLKRPDEKYVTERAYDNPKFVEDLVRDIAMRLDGDDRISHYSLSSENFESIHNHSAYAWLEGPQRA